MLNNLPIFRTTQIRRPGLRIKTVLNQRFAHFYFMKTRLQTLNLNDYYIYHLRICVFAIHALLASVRT